MNTVTNLNERYVALRNLTIETLGLDPSVIDPTTDSPDCWSKLLDAWVRYNPTRKACHDIIRSAFHYIKYEDYHKTLDDRFKPLIQMIAENLTSNGELTDALYASESFKFDYYVCAHCNYKHKPRKINSPAHAQYLRYYLLSKLYVSNPQHDSDNLLYVGAFQKVITDMLPEAKAWSQAQWSDLNLIIRKFKSTYRKQAFTPTDLECLFLLQIPFDLLDYVPNLDALVPSQQFYDMLCNVSDDTFDISRAVHNFFRLVVTQVQETEDKAEIQEFLHTIRKSFYYKLCNHWLIQNKIPDNAVPAIKRIIFDVVTC